MVICVLLQLTGCPASEIEKPNLSNETSGEGRSDELGSGLDDDGAEGGGGGDGELEPNTCLIYPEGDNYGYRHHCGEYMSFAFGGEADGHSVNRSYSYGFGPTYVEEEFEEVDTYDTPSVAACCGGPYDFNIAPSAQRTYFYNCKVDAVQQMCAAVPQWLIKLAEDYPAAKAKLYDAAAALSDGDAQADCVFSLYETGDNFNEVQGTSWDIAVGDSSLTVEVDLIEILEVAYPEPLEVCYSIYENDENLLPLLTEKGSGSLDILAKDHKEIDLFGASAFSTRMTPDEGYAAVVRGASTGDVEIRSLLLRGTAPTTVVLGGVEYTLDTWSLALIGPTRGRAQGSSAVFDAGRTSFTLSASYNGAVFRAGSTNATAFTLEETAAGWELAGLELEFADGNGTNWNLRSGSALLFGR